jgi:hypothetical protein
MYIVKEILTKRRFDMLMLIELEIQVVIGIFAGGVALGMLLQNIINGIK